MQHSQGRHMCRPYCSKPLHVEFYGLEGMPVNRAIAASAARVGRAVPTTACRRASAPTRWRVRGRVALSARSTAVATSSAEEACFLCAGSSC